MADFYVDLFGDRKVYTKDGKEVTKDTKIKKKTGFFQTPELFKDGYQFGDVLGTAFGTAVDTVATVGKGAGRLVEGVGDLALYGVSEVADLFGADGADKWLKSAARTNVVDNVFAPIDNTFGKSSIWGDRSSSILEGVGQVGGMIATGGIGSAAGLGSLGTTMLTAGTMFASSTGSGLSEAYQSGATDEEAWTYGLLKGGIDAGSEMLFGGFGKFVNALGFSRGISSLDDAFAKKVSGKITNRVLRNATEFGIKASGEGVEEVIAGYGSAVAKKLTYASDEELKKLVDDEDLLEQFIVGAMTSGVAQSPQLYSSTKNGTDFVTGYTKGEESVVEAVVQKRVEELKAEGKQVSKRDVSKIYDEVKNSLEKGYIDTDTIESIIGGDEYKSFKDLEKKLEEAEKEYDKYHNMPHGEKTDAIDARQKELASEIESLKKQVSEAREPLFRTLDDGIKGTRLSESYKEGVRASEKFEADLSKYENEFARKTIENYMARGFNNTNRSHDRAEFMAKLAEDRSRVYGFTTTAELEASIKEGNPYGIEEGTDVSKIEALESEKNGVILVNMDANKSFNSLIGHETTHTMEKAGLYGDLQEAVFDLAKSRGEYDDRLESIRRRYANLSEDEQMKELTADLLGDYIFASDPEFVMKLSTERPNLFKRILEEIKHLFKLATSGSDEARQLEKARHLFEKAWRDRGSVSNNAISGTKYSLAKDASKELHKALYDKTYEGEVLLRDETPSIMLGHKDVKKLPMSMKASHIRENVFTEEEAKKQGLRVDKHTHYHGLGEEFFLEIIDGLDNVDLAYRGTKNASDSSRREKYFLLVSQFRDSSGNMVNVPVYINEGAICNRVYIDVNKISTVFGRDKFDEYIARQIKAGNLVRIKNRSNQSSESAALIAEDYEEGAPNNSIPHSSENASEKSVSDENDTSNPDIRKRIADDDLYTPKAYGDTSTAKDYLVKEIAPVAESVTDTFDSSLNENDTASVDSENWRDNVRNMREPELEDGNWTEEYIAYNNSVKSKAQIAALKEALADVDRGMTSAELKQKVEDTYREYERAMPENGVEYTEAQKTMLTILYNQYTFYRDFADNPKWADEMRKGIEYAPVAEDIAPTVETTQTEETSSVEDIAPIFENEATSSETSATEIAPLYAAQPNENVIDGQLSMFEEIPVKKSDEVVKGDSKKSSPEQKQRKWVGTSTESEVVDGKVLPKDLDQDLIHYQPIPNKKTLGNANASLERMGYDTAVQYFNSQFENKKVSLDDIALGERLIQEAVKKEDYETASNLIQNVSILGTELGQKVQALSIIKRLSPEGQLKMLQKTVERGKAKGDKAFEGVEITQEMIDHILKTYGKDGTYDQKKLNKAVEEVKQKIADQMKVTPMEKANAWRYLSMLGNPKTHIRNLVSNVAMRGTLAVKNAVARTIEGIAPIKNRTKTWKASSDAVNKFAELTTNEMKDEISGNSKYSDDASIKQKREIFKNKILNGVYEFNSNMLEKEDWWFSKKAFKESLAEYLTANGIVTEQDIAKNPKIVAKAKAYALEQAQIATFRQYSWLANKINEMEKKNTATSIAVGAILPFKKTPVNIAKTGLSYSPLGFMKTLTYDIAQVKKGNMEASELVDHLSQNVTGTALTLVGYMLASSGLLSGGGEDDKEGKYDYQLGEQAYSVNIGGNSYSLSWLSPVAMPLFVGANAYEQLVEGKEWNGDVVVETLSQTLDPLSEMSFLSSLDDVLSSYDSGVEKFAGIAESMAQNYITQFAPTIMSQVATVTDDKKRSTKVGGDSGFKFFDETINKLKYKIPGLRQTLEPSTDIWGNEVTQTENLFGRAFETFIAPYSKRENIATDIDEEIKSVYRETGDNGIIPSVPYNYTNYGGEKYKMSESEYTQYKQTYGQTASSLLDELFGTETYKASTSEDKAKMINDVYDYAADEAKRELLAQRGIDYTNAESSGTRYYRENPIKGAIEMDISVDEYNFSTANPEKYAFFKDNGMYDKYASADEEGKRAYNWAYENPGKYEVSKVIADNVVEYRQYTSGINDVRADKDKNGKTIPGSAKGKKIAFINGLDLDYGQKIILYRSEYSSDDTYNNDIVEYLNNREDISYDEMVTILKELGFSVSSDGTVSW